MAKKKGGSKGAGGADETVTSTEQPQQAVLLADSFLKTFRPISLDQPKILCPLNNVVLLDYAMDFLAGSGVEELIVICTSEEVERHVLHHTWTNPMTVQVLKDSSLQYAGDALRELDKKNWIASDPFVLMYGDVVANVNLEQAMKQHQERHAKDSAAMMTLVLQQVGVEAPTRGDDLVVGIDPDSQRVLAYDNHSSSKNVKVPCSFFKSHSTVQLQRDLVDTGIYICSPDVLARFSDEFDYRFLESQFIANSVAEEEEGLQNKIFAHTVHEGEYAVRVSTFATYHAVSRDLLQRWCFPVVPDNLPSGYYESTSTRYQLSAHFQYRDINHPPKIGRSSTVTGPGIMGRHVSVGEQCSVTGCVIGHDVKISDNVTLNNCHVWDNVQIESDVSITDSILSQGCKILQGAKISRGCVIGSGCVIGENVVVPEFTRITNAVDVDALEDEMGFGMDDFDDTDDDNSKDAEKPEDQEVVSDPAVVGEKGIGRSWEPYVDDDDSDDDSAISNTIDTQMIGYDWTSLYQQRYKHQAEPNDDLSAAGDNEEAELEDLAFSAYTEGGITFDGSAPAAPVVYGRQEGVDVVKELKEICLEFEETSPIENLSIELNSYKFSQNATYQDCTMGAMLAILDHLKIGAEMSDVKLLTSFKAKLTIWAPLLQKMSMGVPEEQGMIYALEELAVVEDDTGKKLRSGNALRLILQTLHDEEVLSEEAILAWAEQRKSESSEKAKLLELPSIQAFLEWLEESEEEDSSDDDDDDDESD